MKLLLTRHGQSRWQTDGNSAGVDAPLSHLGELQAHRLGRYLRQREKIDRIISSNLSRAHKTATIVASYLDLPVTVEPALREFESWDAGSPPPPRAIWEPAPAAELHPEHRAFRARICAALKQIIGDGEDDETVLLVAHGGTLGTILRLLLGSEVQRIWTLNTALHSLSWTGKFWLIQYLNRVEHLPRPLRSR